MQVRTLIIILVSLQLLLSIISLIYNLANNRTAFSYDHFATPSSDYLASKYQKCEAQIWAIIFGWQIVVIFSQAITGGLFIYDRKLKKQGDMLKITAQILRLLYVLVSSGVIGQTVITGYSIAIITEVGFVGGTKDGDIAITILQSTALVMLLITISILIYNFQTQQQTPQKQLEKTETKNKQQTLPAVLQTDQPIQPDINQIKENNNPHPASPTINIFKPNLLQNTSPMGQHFSQVSQIIDRPPSKRSIKQPLLLPQPNQNAKDEQTIPISSISSRKQKVQVPRLNLQQMKKDKKERRKESPDNKDPLFLLNNLQISAIKPLKYSKIGKKQHINCSDDSEESETIKNDIFPYKRR